MASLYVDSTTSTMDEARGLSAQAPRGLVRAGIQTAGRGRLPGRQWLGEPGASLLVTFWFPPDEFGTAPLPLLAGIAIVRACTAWAEDSQVRFRDAPLLKWPNDTLCGPRKLAGVLCEARGSTMYAGIGLNCRQTGFEPGFRTKPTSILLETGIGPEPGAFLPYLVNAFTALRGIGAAWKAPYEDLLAWRGVRVSFSPGIDMPPVTGELRGVDPTGSVLIAPLGGESEPAKAWPSGELSLVIDESPRT
jgi:BirA family biotin operon repressor/biotin-[acetyl-CoA-carboxylase] ligase